MSSGARTTLAGRYVLESLIATGGMGRVWKARDEVLARPVAIKILHDHLAEDEAFIARFRREAMAAARLTHPHIVAIYDTGSQADDEGTHRHYIVMENCGGGTLATRRDSGPMPADEVIAFGRSICEALEYAHRHDVVHRDIKPENVLITEDGTLKVGDFGIAKAAFATGDLTSTGSILGTVAYISPEQAQGLTPDARSDLYSLGVLLYELVTGRPPFAADTQIATAMMHVREPPAPPRSIRADVPRTLDAVLMKALEKDPDHRYGSAAEMATALDSAGGGATSVLAAATPDVRSHGPPPPSARPGERTELRWVAPVLGIVAVVALLAILIPQFLAPDDGARSNGAGGSNGGSELQVESVADFDPPPGDGSEHADEVNLAIDGRPGTSWTTENYSSPLDVLGKSGVGLVFDLGPGAEVGSIEISGRAGTVEVRAGDDEPTTADDLEVVGDTSVSASAEITLEGVEARYWLVWITRLPDDTGTATISEVAFHGPE
ncbi:MAG: protein kinase domain-containing protein [Actinomycetota bacterium]